MAPRKIQYVNNADLVREINRSKISYCSIQDANYANYDHIVKILIKVDERRSKYINPTIDEVMEMINGNIEEARSTRLKRLNSVIIKDVQKARVCSEKKAKEYIGDRLFSIDDITNDMLVFRVVTYEHIPIDKTDNKTLHFVPFKHYQLIDGALIEVVRSHWEGTIEGGKFNPDLGHITRTLSKMILMLADKFSKKSNFRGYSYREEMVSNALVHLSKSCLLFDEAKVGDQLNPFAYLTQICSNAFKAVLNNEKKARDLRDDILIAHGLAPSNTRQVELAEQLKEANKEL